MSDRAFLNGGGEMGALMRAHDWNSNSLGPPESWPQPLRISLHLLLNSGHPMYVWWGSELTCFYNDAYRRSIGPERHPSSLGRQGREVWDEIWPIIGPQIDEVMSGRGQTWRENALVPITRNGRREDVYWTYSYSPIFDPAAPNGVGGVLVVCSETTQSQRAEQHADQERARFATLFAQAPGFMALLRGPEHYFELANPAYMNLLGHRDVIGKSVVEAIPEAVEQGYVDLLDRVFQSGDSFSSLGSRFMFKRSPDGEPVELYLDFVYQPIKDENGRVTGVFVEGSDVTERKRAEDALRGSEEQLRAVAQAMPNHVWTSLPDGTLDWFNDRVYEYSAAAPGGLNGSQWTQLVHPDDLEGASQRWAHALASGEVYETQFRLRRHDGVYRWHLARAVPLRSKSNVITRWIGTNTDIEEQKNVAATLTRAKERLEEQVYRRTNERDRLWRNSRDLLVIGQGDGTLLSVNEAWTTLLGWLPSELATQKIAPLIHPDDLAAARKVFVTIVDAPLSLPFEFRLKHKDGSYRWFSWTAAYEAGLVYANGRHTTIEHEQAELLERSQESLRQSQKMEAVGQLTGGIAHDFNNMLAIVMGHLDIAARRVKRGDQSALQYLNYANEGAVRAATLTKRLLAFSRQSPLAPEILDANQLIASMSELLRRTLGERIILETVLAGRLWSALADHNQLENAVLNLAVNARDAMPDGGKLTLETANIHLDDRFAATEPGLVAGQYVMVAVSDQGVGMDSDTVRKAFEPFFTTKPVGQGTGLGLSMVYGFLKQSGGHVQIYSEVARGTSVKLYLPRYFGSAAEANIEATRVPLIPTSASHVESVLVVEDDDNVRRMTCEALRELGYLVHEASGGEAAIKIFTSPIRIDIVFTDVVMAGMTGRQLVEVLRGIRPDLKVLYTTGYTRDAVVHNSVLDPGVAFLPKPFSVEELALKLRNVLDSQSS